MKEGVFVINYFAHCVDVEEVYKNMISPVYEKYKLTYMEFTVLMFLANNPQYNTATQIVRYRHLAKSHVSISIRSLQERGLILGEHKGGNHILQAPKHRRAKPCGHPSGRAFYHAANGILLHAAVIHQRYHLFIGARVYNRRGSVYQSV